MVNDKIIQIIPAPADLYSVYHLDGVDCKQSIVCIALIEDEYGEREVKLMAMDTFGQIELIGGNDFKGVSIKGAGAGFNA